MTYDASGNVVAYGTGNGQWSLSYDSMNRLLSATNPDGIARYTSYYSDGSVKSKETAYQHATSTGVAYEYDLDGNVLRETHHYGSNTGNAIEKWYDGADRLIEVQQPQDASDFYTFPWRTRYLYDLTGGGKVSIAGQPYRAYGNLYKTQELLGSPAPMWSEAGSTGNTAKGFQDIAGSATDALDRPTTQYRGGIGVFKTYDVANPFTPASTPTGNSGLLSSTCNGAGECAYPVFDERAHQALTGFSLGNTPSRSYEFDPRGAMVSAYSANRQVKLSYDQDGRELNRTESTPTSPSASTIAYHYYRDGKRASLDIISSATLTSALAYSYRPDGKPSTLTALNSYVFGFTYSAAGRPTSRTAPGGLATNWAYDGYGRVASLATPIGGEASMQYDPEGELTSATPTIVSAGSWNYGALLTSTYSTRGELVNESYVPNPALMADGARIVTTKTAKLYSSAPTGSYTFSAVDGNPDRLPIRHVCYGKHDGAAILLR